MASYPASSRRPPTQSGSGAFYGAAALLLGLAVAVLAFFALMMWADARDARDTPAAETGASATTHEATDHNTALPLSSFAGVVPENAAELAEAHAAVRRDAAGDPRGRPRQGAHDPQGHGRRGGAGREVQHLGVRRPRRARPGRPRARGADGRDDAHERRRDPALDRLPRGTDRARTSPSRMSARRVVHASASRPRIQESSCTTAARSRCSRTSRTGCTARSSSTPKAGLPPVDNEYVLVASEWYLNGDGIAEPASLDMAKARATAPDWTTFNGYANQYVTHPLTATRARPRVSGSSPPGRHSTRTSTSSARSSTERG